jgi:hypothetical protein
MGKSTISMAIFHCYVSSPEGMGKSMEIIMIITFVGYAGWKIDENRIIFA